MGGQQEDWRLLTSFAGRGFAVACGRHASMSWRRVSHPRRRGGNHRACCCRRRHPATEQYRGHGGGHRCDRAQRNANIHNNRDRQMMGSEARRRSKPATAESSHSRAGGAPGTLRNARGLALQCMLSTRTLGVRSNACTHTQTHARYHTHTHTNTPTAPHAGKCKQQV